MASLGGKVKVGASERDHGETEFGEIWKRAYYQSKERFLSPI